MVQYNTFNVIGCNITVVALVFDIINPERYILQISELIAFEYQTLCKIGEMIYFINQCGDPYVSMDKKNRPEKPTG